MRKHKHNYKIIYADEDGGIEECSCGKEKHNYQGHITYINKNETIN